VERLWNTPEKRIRIRVMNDHDEKPGNLNRQSEQELDVLGELLDQLAEDGAMDLEELDGFFAALHCCPEHVLPSEYLPEVLGDGLENEEVIGDINMAQLLMKLILRHWNAVGEAFRTQDFFIPVLMEDEEGKAQGNNWALGFLRGVEMRKESWREILDDESKMGWFVPVFALVTENHPEPEMRPYKEKMTEEQRENLLAGLSVMVTEMYEYFEPHRRREAASRMEFARRNRASKIGRNDPCHCGSGKKYKKCCGSRKAN
jgi:uncharacterized protein